MGTGQRPKNNRELSYASTETHKGVRTIRTQSRGQNLKPKHRKYPDLYPTLKLRAYAKKVSASSQNNF
jgi:hypothetical protein